MANHNNKIKEKLSDFFQKNNRFIVAVLQIGSVIMLISAIFTIADYCIRLMEMHNDGIISELSMQHGIAAMFLIFIFGTSFSIHGWKSIIASTKQLP